MPHESNVKPCNLFVSELNETKRKLAWKLFFEGIPTKEKSSYVRYKKGTLPAEVYLKQLDEPIALTTLMHSNIIETYRKGRSIGKHYTDRYWRHALSNLTCDCRFLQCDKNLGIRLVDEEYYSRLAERESRCYAYVENIELTDESIKLNIERFKAIATIVNAVSASVRLKESPTDKEARQVLQEIAGLMLFSVTSGKEFAFPKLRLLIKIHKPCKPDGLLATRPIVPNFGLPSYDVAKWLGAFMARMTKCIPWALESTDQFLHFIKDPLRSQNVASFDFTNLYGNEPIAETLSLFFSALMEMPWHFKNPSDDIIFKALSTTVDVPDSICFKEVLRCGAGQTSVFMLLLAECIFCTIAELDLGRGKKVLVSTAEFLAMGCPPSHRCQSSHWHI